MLVRLHHDDIHLFLIGLAVGDGLVVLSTVLTVGAEHLHCQILGQLVDEVLHHHLLFQVEGRHTALLTALQGHFFIREQGSIAYLLAEPVEVLSYHVTSHADGLIHSVHVRGWI